MRPAHCPHAESAGRAARTGGWSDELTAHAERCVSCRASAHVVRWMIELAASVASAPAPLPDPHLIWLKVQIRRRSKDRGRALLPIKIWGALSALGLGAGLASAPREFWSRTYEWLASASGALASGLPSLLSVSPPATPWVHAGALMIFLLFLIASEA